MAKETKSIWPVGKYRLEATHHIKRSPDAKFEEVLKEGEEVVFDGRPTRYMIPLDKAAKEACARRDAEAKEAEAVAEDADKHGGFLPSVDELLGMISRLPVKQREELRAKLPRAA